MKINKYTVICIIASIINLVASLIFISRLPDIVPTHFDMNFHVDAIGSKNVAYIFPVIPLLISVGMLLELKLRKKDYANRKVMQIMMIIFSVFFIAMNWMTLFTMQGEAVIGAKYELPFNPAVILFCLIGLMFIAMGNYLPTVAQNHTLGIRISWTLNNEQCWKLTHRLGGKLFVITGIVLLLLAVIFSIAKIQMLWYFVIFMVLLTLLMVIVSVYAYQHRND